jgi:phage/plasmid primase-like uncharacterized protein
MADDACDIAARLRLRAVRQGQWRGDCPACGYTGSLILRRTDAGRPLWWCASCEDGRAIAGALRKWGFALPDRSLRATRLARPANSDDLNTGRALALWEAAAPARGLLPEIYLQARGLGLPTSAPLRFIASCPHPSGGRLPAMLALVTTADGRAVAIHRTFLAPNGKKAAVEPARATLGPIRGHAVVLHPPEPEVVVGEGLESTLAAAELFGLPGIAALTAGSLATARWLPSGVERVVIAADNDASGTGQRAAEEAARLLSRRGLKVRIAMPNATAADFNDLLLARRTGDVSHA